MEDIEYTISPCRTGEAFGSVPPTYKSINEHLLLRPARRWRFSRTDPQSTKASIGSDIILAGTIMQTLWSVFFVVGAACFHYRMRAYPTNVVRTCPEICWQRYLLTLYVVSGLVIVRSIFRLAEFAQGHDGYLQSKEALFYAFDSLMMLILLVSLNWQHPGEIALLLRTHDPKMSDGLTGERLESLPQSSNALIENEERIR